MPTYEYSCSSCGHEFERIQKISDRPLANCPRCGAPAERLISGGAGLVFKGPGFYATDYRKPSGPREGEGKGESNVKDAGKESTSADSSGSTDRGSGSGKEAGQGGE